MVIDRKDSVILHRPRSALFSMVFNDCAACYIHRYRQFRQELECGNRFSDGSERLGGNILFYNKSFLSGGMRFNAAAV